MKIVRKLEDPREKLQAVLEYFAIPGEIESMGQGKAVVKLIKPLNPLVQKMVSDFTGSWLPEAKQIEWRSLAKEPEKNPEKAANA